MEAKNIIEVNIRLGRHLLPSREHPGFASLNIIRWGVQYRDRRAEEHISSALFPTATEDRTFPDRQLRAKSRLSDAATARRWAASALSSVGRAERTRLAGYADVQHAA